MLGIDGFRRKISSSSTSLTKWAIICGITTITGRAMEKVLKEVMGPDDKYRGVVLTTGSAGTIACGDYMKKAVSPPARSPPAKRCNAQRCYNNGFGAHRIEGIGDKHVPWIHNVKNTDMVMAIDDAATMGLIRLFNEPAGREYLANQGVPADIIDNLDLLGISRLRQPPIGHQVRQVL